MGDETQTFTYLPPDLADLPLLRNGSVLSLFPDGEVAAGFINWCQTHGITQSLDRALAYLAGYNAAQDVAEARQHRPVRTRPITL